jgi:hypothetical protein
MSAQFISVTKTFCSPGISPQGKPRLDTHLPIYRPMTYKAYKVLPFILYNYIKGNVILVTDRRGP